jgi:hydroxymethylpyrimidine pyrophosphatase-like HAD family hydrolase
MTDTNQTLHKVQQFIANRMPSGIIHSVFSAVTYLELFASDVSKGSALEGLLEITGVKRERVIAIGDYCNDIEMMKASGLGVATANAHPLLKEAADITAVSNDEHAIYNLINKILPIYANISDKNAKPRFSDEMDKYVKIPV